ncbi:MAG: TlpA family protein disulfide reductase [Elusimicrobia bacterium]|nr:TlpA family protein disulfide reductase [Elusimicrobiota bacterium]MDE2236402.1 TlpA family protein disulfide reductase [Elusimicrobiota bacterium]MDE2425135.1 TlpA family protein disulfide reductase [Elusimicrobiota bacterium]
MSKRTSAAAFFFLAAAGLYLILSRPADTVAIGKRAPSFTLADISGRTVSLSDYRGKVVLLNFWASWCPICRQEFPDLQAVYQRRRRDGFALIAASVDDGGERAVLPFIAEQAPTFTICLADLKTQQAYGVRDLPTSFLIGPDGAVKKEYIGSIDPAELENDILSQLPRRRS